MVAEQSRSDPPPLPRPNAGHDWRERLDIWRERLVDQLGERPLGRALLGAVALAGTVVVAFLLLRPQPAAVPIETALPPLEPDLLVATPEPAPSTIVVHVAGAVRRPGLVELPAGARVADAVAGGGGPTADADLDRVNLATVLEDADHVAVPRFGEEPPAVSAPAGTDAAAAGPLDLNRADVAALETLPGVGPATAAAIVAHREEHGPFASVTALDEVPGIGPAKLDRLRDLVTVGP